MPPFALTWQVFTAPKAGHRPDENEDAAAGSTDTGRFAVADGASEGWQSGPWAAHLAAAFVADPPEPGTFPAWLAAARRSFPAGTSPAAGSLSWYAEAKRAQGAFATLLGLTLRPLQKEPGLGWKGCAVGDACGFQVRGGVLVAAFPLDSAAAFGSSPPLVGSAGAVPEPAWVAGRAEPGDVFYLATDAAAEWLLRRAEAGGDPAAEWEKVFADRSPSRAFGRWVDSTRSTRLLRNDDATLGRVLVRPPAPEPPR
jgi:hypothetical protein